ncbi:hypothetical protein [Clostridium cylindrosporum]|uniref:Uncharacterized protein n=1 Tax=Clostridium cylindrosporum DSM 605 TaxID=1121307 RepID=A0A0J8G007_CLOCY|nr:hypothetical protein [Clostridium cylindrosporum]KMT21136.1 hypothetical protein CLCY_1c03700 [Clostridium cylindrosporum DSM 605]
MNSNLTRKMLFVGISLLDILGIICCIFIYSSIFTVIPWHESISLRMIFPIIFVFLLTGFGFYFISNYIPIAEKRIIMSVIEVLVVFISFMLLEIFAYPYSLVLIIAIANLAFNVIILCEVLIYLIQGYKILKISINIK